MNTDMEIVLMRLREGFASFLRSMFRKRTIRVFIGVLIIATAVCGAIGFTGLACVQEPSPDVTISPASNPVPSAAGISVPSATPVIRNLKVTDIKSSSCTITWQTDMPAMAEVTYLVAGGGEKKVWSESKALTQHSVTLESLQPATEYAFVVKVTSLNGGKTALETGTFTTEPLERRTGTEIGNLAPDFTLPDTSGKMISLKNYRGKWVMLVFWDIYCSSCRAQMSQLQIYFNNKPDNLEVISVNIGEVTEDQLLSMLKSRGITYPVLMDRSQDVAVEYRISVYPTAFMIDVEGVIRGFREQRFDTHGQVAEFVESIVKK